MTKHTIVCGIIGTSQLVLGALYLLIPSAFITWQGLGPITADIGYPLAMLAARFLVYGAGMLMIARQPERFAPWLDGMILIQAIDLGAGLFFVGTGAVALADAALPMGNAFAFILALIWVRRPNRLQSLAA